MTHTPGPWRVGKRSAIQNAVFDGKAVPYPVIPIEGAGAAVYAPNTSPEAKANARLIAAAPDLLEACKAYEAYWTTGTSTGEPVLSKIRCQMQAAIAKAEGVR